MRNKAFTLIELLAVIVILAIIALIATPIILGIIKDARENSKKRSAELVYTGVEYAYTQALFKEGSENVVDDVTLETIDKYLNVDNISSHGFETSDTSKEKLHIVTKDNVYCEVTKNTSTKTFEVKCGTKENYTSDNVMETKTIEYDSTGESKVDISIASIKSSASATQNYDNIYNLNFLSKYNFEFGENFIREKILTNLDSLRLIITLSFPQGMDLDWGAFDVNESTFYFNGGIITYKSLPRDIYEFESISRNGNKVVMIYKFTTDIKDMLRTSDGFDIFVNGINCEEVVNFSVDDIEINSFGDKKFITTVDFKIPDETIRVAEGSALIVIEEE